MVEQKADFKHIVRIANVDIPGDKGIRFALTKIKGIGVNMAHAVCNIAQIDLKTKAGNLSDKEIALLNEIVTHPLGKIPPWMYNRKKDFETGEDMHLFTGNLQFYKENDLKRLKKIKCYRGIRHIHGQPVRGQRTRSNFRTSKGKVVGVVKTKAAPGAEKKDEGKGRKGKESKGKGEKGKK